MNVSTLIKTLEQINAPAKFLGNVACAAAAVVQNQTAHAVRGLLKELNSLEFEAGLDLDPKSYDACERAIRWGATMLAAESRKRREEQQKHEDYSIAARARLVS